MFAFALLQANPCAGSSRKIPIMEVEAHIRRLLPAPNMGAPRSTKGIKSWPSDLLRDMQIDCCRQIVYTASKMTWTQRKKKAQRKSCQVVPPKTEARYIASAKLFTSSLLTLNFTPPSAHLSYGQTKTLVGPSCLRGESFGSAGVSHRCCVTLSHLFPSSCFFLLFLN